MIRKLPSQNKWRLYSRKKIMINGVLKHRNLGTFLSKTKAEKHEREIQFFKHRGG